MKPKPSAKNAGEQVSRCEGEPEPRFRNLSHFLTFPLSHFLVVLLVAPLAVTDVRGVIPEPDNILYGTITLDNQPVTAARTDVVVEARRLINGPAIVRYRMGSNPTVGNFYSLRLALESLVPVTDANASQVGDSLFIVVTDASGIRTQTTYDLADRGAVQRVDFGGAVSDSDGDGLADAWEALHFGGLGQGPASVSLNGRTALQNYIAGTNPNDTNSVFGVGVTLNNNITLVSFQALRAEGIGYEGRNRFYSLEQTANPASGWQGVTGFTNVPGNNTTITYPAPGTNSSAFYRGRVWLQ